MLVTAGYYVASNGRILLLVTAGRSNEATIDGECGSPILIATNAVSGQITSVAGNVFHGIWQSNTCLLLQARILCIDTPIVPAKRAKVATQTQIFQQLNRAHPRAHQGSHHHFI